MENKKLPKNTPSFEQNHRDSLELSPLTGIPFASAELRPHSELRINPLFFSALLTNVGKNDIASSTIYPWDSAPLVWAIDRGSVLTSAPTPAQQGGTAQPSPLDISKLLSLAALEDYADTTHEVADFIFAGVSERAGARRPVLALINHHENYLRESHLNMQGPENQELTLNEYLAERTAGSWITIRSFAEYHEEKAEILADAHCLASASALANWHASHRFDPATGEATIVTQAGWSRTAPRGAELFPRTDPAVITAVTATIDGEDKLLLGNARAWEEHRYSTFAGFVEAGETLENAVARELFEECGGKLEALSYRGSQPWPFPRSLMLGYTARISNPESVEEDGEEIRQIRWFTRAELQAAEETGEIILPSSSSISRKLIDDWLHHADR